MHSFSHILAVSADDDGSQGGCTKVSVRRTVLDNKMFMIVVEYAMEAISHAGTVLGVLAKDGVVLAAEKKVTGKLLDLSGTKEGGYGGSGEKIFLLNSYVSPPSAPFVPLNSAARIGMSSLESLASRRTQTPS